MDPLAHSLVGATLARTGQRRSPLAMATLLIAANLPDLDGLLTFSADARFHHRRGLTHGVLALVVLPLLLALGILAYDRLVRSRRGHAPVRAPELFVLSGVGVLSHLLLDWLNIYGVRLLMPFDGRWFDANALFIIDPWMWLICALAPMLAYTRSRGSTVAWSVLGALTTAIVLVTNTPLAAKIGWALGIAVLVLVRLRWVERELHITVVARGALAALLIYAATMVALSAKLHADLDTWARARGELPSAVVVIPSPADPSSWSGFYRIDDEYRFATITLSGGLDIQPDYAPLSAVQDKITRAAMAAPDLAGFRIWARYPAYAWQEDPGGYRVTIRDVRYVRDDAQSEGDRFGEVVVYLDRELQPRSRP